MRPRPLLVAVLACLAGTTLLGQQGTLPPPIVPPVVPPTTGPIGISRGFGPRQPNANVTPAAAVIVGEVVDQAGRAIEKAAVRLIGEGVVETVLTDARGRFFFTRVPPGEAIVTARKYGYVDGGYGQERAGGQPLTFTLQPGQAMTGVRIRVFKAGVITGSVVDEVAEPILGARVIALRRTFANGTWRFVEAGADVTDDTGFYRIFGLMPGEYVVTTPSTRIDPTGDAVGSLPVLFFAAARRGNGADPEQSRDWLMQAFTADSDQVSARPLQFYPATDSRLLALPVAVEAGGVRYAVDFQLPVVGARTVSGRLVKSDGPDPGQLVRLVPVDADEAIGQELAVTGSRQDGTFTFSQVPSGRYRLEAGNPQAPTDNDVPARWARVELTVTDSDIDLADVPMRSAARVRAGFLTAGLGRAGAPAQTSGVKVTLIPAEPGLSPTRALLPTQDGLEAKLIPGRYFVRVGSIPPGWAIRSMTAGGQNLLDEPLELLESTDAYIAVTLTDRVTEVIGSVRDARMRSAAGATIIVFPASASNDGAWGPHRVKETRASTGGVFVVRGLPPGDYFIVAIDDAEAEGWQDPRVIKTLRALATRVSLRDQESRTLQLRLSKLR
jgi:hypothetical protein